MKNTTDRSRKAPELLKNAHTQIVCSKTPESILNRNRIAAAICDTVKTTLNENKCDKQKVRSDAPKKRASFVSIESPCDLFEGLIKL